MMCLTNLMEEIKMEWRPTVLNVRVTGDSGDTATSDDVAIVIKIVADQIENGYISGKFADIAWELNGTYDHPIEGDD